MQPIIITIDGYSSCGKSTLAKGLAKALDYIFIDSGAMYRAVTLHFLRNKISLSNHADIDDALQHIHLSFQRNKSTGGNDIFLNGEDVSLLVRDMVISNQVSEVAAIREVREFAVAQQRKIGSQKRSCDGWKRHWHYCFSRCRTENFYDCRCSNTCGSVVTPNSFCKTRILL